MSKDEEHGIPLRVDLVTAMCIESSAQHVAALDQQLGRATTAARGVSRSMKEADDVARAEQRLQEAQQQLQQLQDEMAQEIAALAAIADPAIETTQVAAKKTNVEVRLVALAWTPGSRQDL